MQDEHDRDDGLAALWPAWRPEWIVYEDDLVMVVNKPAGLAVHKTEHPEKSDLCSRVATFLRERDGACDFLAALFGLDREASGVVVLSKDKATNKALVAQLERGLERSYLVALERAPRGRLPFSLEVLQRRDARLLCRASWSARSQPLRRELARAGAPIAGDEDGRGAAAQRLLLHAESVQLDRPGGPQHVVAPPPFELKTWTEHQDLALPDTDHELRRRLTNAIDARYGVWARHDSDAYRLVHGAGDGLPGIELDRYGRWAVLALVSDEADAARERILDAVAELGFAGVYLKRRPKHASVLADTRTDAVAPAEPLRGTPAPDPLVVREAGLDYVARLGDGLSTGLFLDQRAAREWLRKHSRGRRVLNLFAYHGAFTIAALAGEARETVSVDASGVALERAAENLALHHADRQLHALVRAEVQSYLRKAAGEPPFDLILLDPPSFATTRRSRFRASRDYRPLAAACFACLAPGGVLLACTNHRGTTLAKLRRELARAAEDAGRRIATMDALADPIDFPAAPGKPCHLKRVLVQLSR